jgi:2',3'-cyclic-nucleotide 2'-phosphodiesterase (5'-nucleotidase family)
MEAGNWLFPVPKNEKSDTNYVKEIAELQAEAYKEISYNAINVGMYDLNFGCDYLVGLSRKYNLPFISANLINEKDELIFPSSMIFKTNGIKIGLIGITADNGNDNRLYRTKHYIEAIRHELEKLQANVDCIILLTDINFNKIKNIADNFSRINLIVRSGGGLMMFTDVRKIGHLYHTAVGYQGRSIIELNIHKKRLGDFTDITRLKKQIKYKESRIKNYKERAGDLTVDEYFKNDKWVMNRVKQYQKDLQVHKKTMSDIHNYFEVIKIDLNKNAPEDSVWQKRVQAVLQNKKE